MIWQREADKAARRHGVDPKILRNLVGAESGGNPNARSPAGARGLAQFMPATAKAYGVNLNDNRISDDLDGAARYLAENLKRTGGDYRAALSIYNSGRPDGYKSIPETRAYVQKILGGSNPSASPATSSQRPSTRTATTTSGPSEAEQRSSVLGNYLATRGQPGALLGLGVGLGNIQAPTTTTRTTSAPSSATPASKGSGKLLELFWQGPGGINAKDGKAAPQGFVTGHKDHVHVAAGPKTVVQLGQLAQQMGLHVGENPHFGGVAPVHVQNSYHYKGEAIDVSGSPAKMRAYAHRVASMYGIR